MIVFRYCGVLWPPRCCRPLRSYRSTQHGNAAWRLDAPCGWGARRVRGSNPHAVFTGGAAIVRRPLRRVGGQQLAGEGGKARVFVCAIGVQSVLSSTHAHPHVRQLAANVARLVGEQASTVTAEMPIAATALPCQGLHCGDSAGTYISERSRKPKPSRANA
jgi:hypothetical protein